MTGLWLVSYIALWILFLLVVVVLLSVLRNLGVIYESISALTPRLHSAPTKLKAGEVLPPLTWQTLSGDEKSLSEFRGAKAAISVVSPTCGPCRDFLKNIVEDGHQPDPLDQSVRNRLIVSVGDIAMTRELITQIGLSRDVPVLVDAKNRVATEWGITSTPMTVIVDDQLRVVRQLFGI